MTNKNKVFLFNQREREIMREKMQINLLQSNQQLNIKIKIISNNNKKKQKQTKKTKKKKTKKGRKI